MILTIKRIPPPIIIFLFISFFYSHSVEAAPVSDNISNLNVEKISTVQGMETALATLHTSYLEAKKNSTSSYAIQKQIIETAGQCLSRIKELERRDGTPSDKRRVQIRALFEKNRGIIKTIQSWNEKIVEDIQEYRLDKMKNPDAFYSSPEWQQPLNLISLSSYWLSWNNYYLGLFYQKNDPLRKSLLDEAAEGFSRASIDFNQKPIIVRSLFGRALCNKEKGRYEKAEQDLKTTIGMIPRNDPLYVRCMFEKIHISFLKEDYDSALKQTDDFPKKVRPATIPSIMTAELKKLRITIALKKLEKGEGGKGKAAKQLYFNILYDMKALAAADPSQAGELYRYVRKYVSLFDDLPFGDLGPVGNLALADWYFNEKKYYKAGLLYKRLSFLSDTMIKKRLDDIYFRQGYSLCRQNKWEEALLCFETFFKKFSRSEFIGKTACLRYVAAANYYRDNPTKKTYGRYIDSITSYLKYCPDPGDKSEAHFQMGKYYQDRGNSRKAFREFSLVGDDSQNYPEALYFVIVSGVERLEGLSKKGLNRSKNAKTLYPDTMSRLKRFREKFMNKMGDGKKQKELKAQTALLRAKLYIYGPEPSNREALKILTGFENRFAGASSQMFFNAGYLRMECYQRLAMINEARQELKAFMKQGGVTSQRWKFLNEWATRFDNEAKRFRISGKTGPAGTRADIAIMVYEKLSSIAEKNKRYRKYFETIQLRLAEMYLDKHETEKAKDIYRKKLERDPLSADALYNLGLINEMQGQWGEALKIWRRFSKGMESGSHYWYEARYGTAKALNRLGKGDDACEVISMTRVLHPELRDEQFKEKFLLLQSEICSEQ